MKNGKFGISTTITAAIAFALCALKRPEALILVTGYALLVEKDSWLNRQVIQALLLSLTYYIIMIPIDWLFGGFANLIAIANPFSPQVFMGTIHTVLGQIIYIALIVFSIIAICRILKGAEANLPILAKFADPDFKVVVQSSPQQESKATPIESHVSDTQDAPSVTPPETPAEPAQTVEPTEPIEPKNDSHTPAPVEDPIQYCSNCGNPVDRDSTFCSQCGAKVQ